MTKTTMVKQKNTKKFLIKNKKNLYWNILIIPNCLFDKNCVLYEYCEGYNRIGTFDRVTQKQKLDKELFTNKELEDYLEETYDIWPTLFIDKDGNLYEMGVDKSFGTFDRATEKWKIYEDYKW